MLCVREARRRLAFAARGAGLGFGCGGGAISNRNKTCALRREVRARTRRRTLFSVDAKAAPDESPAAAEVPWYISAVKFCAACGGAIDVKRGDAHDPSVRPVCSVCSKTTYVNPKVVVGSVCVTQNKERVLLCKRAIPPVGKWTLPAGFMEMGETRCVSKQCSFLEGNLIHRVWTPGRCVLTFRSRSCKHASWFVHSGCAACKARNVKVVRKRTRRFRKGR